jgi:ABC-2 type transport system permease protein
VSIFLAVLRYEFRMQVRKGAVWLVPGLSLLLLLLVSSLLLDLFDPEEGLRVSKDAMVGLGLQLNALLSIGYGCLLADRLIRDERLRVAPILDATPAPQWPRLLGKYFGTAAATAVPIVAIYAGLAGAYAVHRSTPAPLGWALLIFALVILPGMLFVAAFALTVPLTMPPPLFRVLFVGYWIWGNLAPPDLMPTLARSIVQPVGGYPVNALLNNYGPDGDAFLAGPIPGATLNFLRPEPTAATGWLSIAILLALAAAALAWGQALRTRRAEGLSLIGRAT